MWRMVYVTWCIIEASAGCCFTLTGDAGAALCRELRSSKEAARLTRHLGGTWHRRIDRLDMPYIVLMMMLVNICDTMFECHFDAVWKGFCDSCLHRFGFGFFRFTGEHDASQPWTKLGFGEWMQLRDGNCNQSWASRSESSSQVPSRPIIIWYDFIRSGFYQEFVLDEVAFAVFLCSFAQWTIKRCQLPWTWAALPCQKVLLVWMVENCQSIDSNTCFLVLVLTPNIEFCLQAPTQMTRAWCQVLFKLRPESQLRVGSSQPQQMLNRVQVMERPATSLRRQHVQTTIDRKNFGRPASMD